VNSLLQDFNAVIFTNATTVADIEGAAVIGGSFSGATLYNNPGSTTLLSGFGALTVYGSTSGNPINIDNGGSAYVGGTKDAIINFNGGGSYIGVPAYTIGDLETALTAQSIALSRLSANSVLPAPDNNEVIRATPDSSGVAVFNISANDLSNIPSYKIDLNGASTIVFNVSGNVVNFSANNETGTLGATKIIWNFYQATSVTFGTQVAGTVVAPYATVTNHNQIDGTLVAYAFNGQGELHNYGFDGNIANAAPQSAVPEPAVWSMMVIGLGLIGLSRRKRLRARLSLSGERCE
jgi:choice-of-anchor A domain-containing protein